MPLAKLPGALSFIVADVAVKLAAAAMTAFLDISRTAPFCLARQAWGIILSAGYIFWSCA
ncbi:hypothetical protein EGT09_25400 [Pseudomonas putida]|uniref:Uncharacterized protein n=1 Tax=Pseudomonas putida TaxID=303 RepID=A0AAD0L866_PSEPU|nr:hypothetical protein AB688_21265 [Pseudomonas putida]AXA26232.1 hypothetical protein C1S65_19745 [Pseudomonas putida]RSC29587.1 hypothetical protein EGT09_25400 [Pseudomonas putida]